MRRKVITIVLLLLAVVAAAQTTGEKKDTIIRSLDEIVVTAQRHKQQTLLVPYSVNAISQQYLSEMGSRPTPEAL